MALTRRQLALSREIAAAQTVSAAAVLVADTAGALEREAALLARDPALVEGAAKGDWATVARFGSPRIQALTREGVAEFVVVRDVIGAPLLQVPAVPPPAVPSFTALTRPIVTLKVINGRPLLLVAAPIWSAGSTDGASRIPVGMIVAGRRFEDLGRAIEQLSMRPGLVVLAGDRLVAATRPGMPEAGWVTAVTSGRTTIGSESFMLHPLRPEIIDSADGAL